MPLSQPQRDTLRIEFDKAVSEMPNAAVLTNGFNARIGAAVFEAHLSALESAENRGDGPAPLSITSAPPGRGKTSFALAFHAALVRASITVPSLPKGSLILVHEKAKAEEVYCDLAGLIP